MHQVSTVLAQPTDRPTNLTSYIRKHWYIGTSVFDQTTDRPTNLTSYTTTSQQPLTLKVSSLNGVSHRMPQSGSDAA